MSSRSLTTLVDRKFRSHLAARQTAGIDSRSQHRDECLSPARERQSAAPRFNQGPGDNRGLEISRTGPNVADMDRTLANYTVNALQVLFEACNLLASELPAAKREKVEKLLAQAQRSRAAIMALMME